MRERFVRVRHTMCVVFLLHRVAAIVGGIENLGRETIRHRFFAAPTRVGNNPTNSQGTAPLLVNFNWNLVRRTTNAPRLNFDRGFHVVDGAFENLQWLLTGLVADLLHGIVKDALGHALLALPHHAADELRHQWAAVNRIGKDFASFSFSSSWHIVLSSNSVAISLPRATAFSLLSSDVFFAPLERRVFSLLWSDSFFALSSDGFFAPLERRVFRSSRATGFSLLSSDVSFAPLERRVFRSSRATCLSLLSSDVSFAPLERDVYSSPAYKHSAP